MNKLRIAAAAMLLAGSALGLYGQDFAAAGLDLIGQSDIEDGVQYRLTTEAGKAVVVRLPDDAPRLESDQVNSAVEFIDGLELMQFDTVRVVQHGQVLELVIVPPSFEFQGVELAEYLPAGVQLFIDDEIEFDFRMVVGEYFLRIDGRWFTETQFADTLLRAVENPQAFLRSRDPEVLLQRLLESERRIDAMQSRADATADSLRRLQREHEQLEQEADSTAELLRYLQEAVYIEHTRGFFGGLHLPEPNLIARLRELKDAEPQLGLDELREQLREEGFSVSASEVALIISIYYNEHTR